MAGACNWLEAGMVGTEGGNGPGAPLTALPPTFPLPGKGACAATIDGLPLVVVVPAVLIGVTADGNIEGILYGLGTVDTTAPAELGATLAGLWCLGGGPIMLCTLPGAPPLTTFATAAGGTTGGIMEGCNPGHEHGGGGCCCCCLLLLLVLVFV